jgi:oxygen-dependent protoporphyrinogen oxidase
MKHIAIIGGGISGLAALHYFRKHSYNVTLYEQGPQVGGTVSTQNAQGFLFESGPNSFLSNPSTLEFIEELGISDQLIYADEASKRRYIQLDGKLLLLPSDPFGFLQTPLLSATEKMRFISGLLNSNVSKDQSVYDYASKRFGEVVTDRFIDPFLTGIYAGDIKRLHMEYAFPKMGTGKGILCSFKNGMGSLIAHLYQKYQSHILTSAEIQNIKDVKADLIIVSTPAYVAANLLGFPILDRVVYSPIAVVGLKVNKKFLETLPDGFGYLIPSSEGKEVLGVLLESNVFRRETNADEIVIRVMLGGAHHPEIVHMSEQELTEIALREIDLTYGLKGHHLTAIKVWPKGIPQYDLDYPKLIPALQEELRQFPHVRLCANYIGGISFNDCIKNARSLVETLS